MYSIKDEKENIIISNEEIKSDLLENCKINFKGTNNTIYVEQPTRFENVIVNCNGNNSIVFLGKNTAHAYKINLTLHNSCYIYFGGETYFNSILSVHLVEHQGIVIGKDCLIAYDVSIKVSDSHLIYKDNKRINLSKTIIIGDHVWIGQSVILLKGTQVHSGSVVGAGSVGRINAYSNTISVGNPIKVIKNDIVWTKDSVNVYREYETNKMLKLSETKSEALLFNEDEETIDFNDVDNTIKNCIKEANVDKTLRYLILFHEKGKNRMAMNNQNMNLGVRIIRKLFKNK
jgi:acetyltransferase-like isoleucine patch superfamily enzyme